MSGMILPVAAAWVLSLAFDVFLHGGLLARLYTEPGPFLLEADEAFRRIPLGYLAFLGLTLALYWLLRRLGVRGAMAGFRHGSIAGAVVWGALAGRLSLGSSTPGSPDDRTDPGDAARSGLQASSRPRESTP